MNCKKCGSLIDNNANFCPYCGEKIINQEMTNKEYNDPFKDIRVDNTHASQYNYQQNYSNQKPITYDSLNPKPKNNISLIGLILGISSIFISFSHISIVGIIIAILSFILAIIGFNKTNRALGVTSIVITIFTFIITIIINVFVFVGSIELTLTNGYKTSIKDYLIDAFKCGYNEHKIKDYWINNSNELLYLDNSGNYYIYLDATDLTDNYYYGNYSIEDGVDLGDEEYLFADENYYLYDIDTSLNKTKEGKIYYETIELIENGFTLKLDKKNHNRLILVGSDGETEIEFKRQETTF